MAEKNKAAVELGRRGGLARAKLAKERLSEMGRKAAEARWKDHVPKDDEPVDDERTNEVDHALTGPECDGLERDIPQGNCGGIDLGVGHEWIHVGVYRDGSIRTKLSSGEPEPQRPTMIVPGPPKTLEEYKALIEERKRLAKEQE